MATIGLHYMKEFACLGPECPATCCQGWGIHFTKSGFHALQDKKKSSPVELRTKQWFTVLPETQRTDAIYAMADKVENGNCVALDREGLCDIHKNFGPNALPSICDSFPRRVFQENDSTLIYGEVSCPPIAKEVLTNPNALIYEEFEDFPAERLKVHQVLMSPKTSTYENAQGIFREVGIHLLSLESYSLDQRLLALLNFSVRISEVIQKNSKNVDVEAFEACVGEFMSPTPPLLHNDKELNGPEGVQVTLRLISLLANHANPDTHPQFSALIQGIFDQFKNIDTGGTHEVSHQEIGTWVQNNLKALHRYHGGIFDGYILRAGIHSWLSRPYRKHVTLLNYATELAGFLHSFRFCMANHPSLLSAEGEISIESFEMIAIDTLFGLARSLEHGPNLSKALVSTRQAHALESNQFLTHLATSFR